MKKRLLATVLTLAMLCPMIAYFASFGTFAALEVDDGMPVSSSNVLCEEWNFDDMAEGEVLTGGYISSHSKGNFTSATKATDGLAKPEKWTAVADTQNGGNYIYSENAYLAFDDSSNILLKNTYEISWRMRVDAIGSSTTLLWWSETEDVVARNCLLRYNQDGTLGYTKDNSYQSTVTVSTRASIGEWHGYRARISPTDGRVWLWFDGELIIDGVVNEFLRDNAKNAQNSAVGIFFAWGNSGMKVAVDDIKITGVSVDEHLTFDNPKAIDPFLVSWDFNDGAPASKGGVTVSPGTGYTVSTVEGDTVNTSKVMHFSHRTVGKNIEGPAFTLPGKTSDYASITVSFKVRHNYSDNFVNMLRVQNKDGGSNSIFRVTSMKDESGATANLNFLADNGTNAGKIIHGEWDTVTVVINPMVNKVTATITNSSGTTEKVISGYGDLKTLFNGLIENDKPFKFLLYAHYGALVDIMFDDVSISATPASYYGKELLDFEEFDAGTTLNADMISEKLDVGFFDFRFTNGGDTLSKIDPKKSTNKALYLGNRIMWFEFKRKLSDYEKVHMSFDVMFEQMGGYTSFMSVNDTDGSGKEDNFIRLQNTTNKIGYSTTGSNEKLIATLTQGADAKWYTFGFDITPSTGEVIWTVTERDTGASVVNQTFTSTPIKNVYLTGEKLKIRLNYTWDSNFKAYFDNIAMEASAPIESTVNSGFKDSSFEMVDSEISGMDNEDWKIAADPALEPLSATWDFNDGAKASSKNGITVGDTSNVTIAEVGEDTVNTTKVLGTSGYETAQMPEFTLPGTINDYETITVAFKCRVDEATNVLNMFRVAKKDGTGKYTNFFRVGAMDKTTSISKIGWKSDPKDSNVVGTLKKGEWNDFSMTFTPSSGNIDLIINGTKVTYAKDSAITALRDGNKVFSVMVYYHTGPNMTATAYIDDISISAKPKLDYTENEVLKTVTDKDGNTHGIFAIRDNDKLLTKQPFEISFDYMMNQKLNDWLNFVKIKMNNTNFNVFRLAPNGHLYNYTSTQYTQYYGLPGTSGTNIGLNVANKQLAVGKWYNIRVVVDPTSGHIMGYVDNELVCDYNINDVYIDENGVPLGVTENPTQMYIELVSQWTSNIKINDSCIDNLRIRTLNYNEYTKTVLADADFDGMAKGELTADTFAKATGLYAKSLAGSFNVVGTDIAKYVDATVKGGEGIAVDMTNVYAPLATETVSFEGNFTFTAFGDSGKLDIYRLNRDGADAASLLSVNSDGRLYVGTTDTGVILSLGTVYNIKLIFSGASGTAELYINGEFITAASVISGSGLPKLTYKDSMGNDVAIGNKRFMESESATVKTLSGVKLRTAEMPNPFKAQFPEDRLYFLAVNGDGTWTVKFDDLSVAVDRFADVYSESEADSFAFADVNGTLWGNDFIAQFTYNSDSSEVVSLVDWTLGASAISLVKVGGGKLYAADGVSELVTLGENDDIAVAVKSEYWESHVPTDNYPVDVVVYVNGKAVGTYNVIKSDATSSGALVFGEGVSNARVYLGSALRNNRVPADESGVKFEGYTAFSVDFEDEKFFDTAKINAINYVEWAFPSIGKTVTDMDGAAVALAEYIVGEDNSFMRLRRPEFSGKPSSYMEYNLAAMGEYSALYSVELDMRFIDNLASSMCVARLYDKNMSGECNVLLVDYENRFYFVNNGIRYYLCDAAGNALICKKPSDDSFTKVGLVINNAEGCYSIWIDGMIAYYYSDGQSSGKPVRATEIPIDYMKEESYTLCAPKIRLFEGSNNGGSDSVADIDNINIEVIKNGMKPVNVHYQVNELGNAVRFVATVDTLYANSVGFEMIASSNLENDKFYSDSSELVFSSIIAGKDENGDNVVVTAEELGGRYIAVFSVTELPAGEYIFKVKPFVELFGEKIYGEESVYVFPEN